MCCDHDLIRRARGTTRGYLMSRVQLALNVDDIDAAVNFYSTLFNAEPAKRRPGYATSPWTSRHSSWC